MAVWLLGRCDVGPVDCAEVVLGTTVSTRNAFSVACADPTLLADCSVQPDIARSASSPLPQPHSLML